MQKRETRKAEKGHIAKNFEMHAQELTFILMATRAIIRQQGL